MAYHRSPRQYWVLPSTIRYVSTGYGRALYATSTAHGLALYAASVPGMVDHNHNASTGYRIAAYATSVLDMAW
eukprot:2907160-Rhodomonas_salina.2